MAKRSLLLIVLGIAIGASMGFAGFYQTTNNITFKILPTGKVYLAPKVGDVITWQLVSGAPVKIFFPFKSPCSDSPGSTTCHVTSPKGIFDYTCKDTGGGGSVICTDPGIDPDPSCCGPSGAPSGAGPSVSGLATNSEVTALQIGCSSGKVSVVDSNSASSPTINAGGIVQWTSPDQTFTVSGTSLATACASSSLTGDVQWCNSTSSPTTHPLTVNYTVTVSGASACPTPSGTFTFKLK